MLELHIANKNYSSWSLRPWLLMRALDIPFREHLHAFEPASDWSAYRRISPSGLVPCLVDGDVAVWDSLAITEYLHERFPGVWPADPRSRAWARCAAAEMHSGFGALRTVCSMSCGVRIRLHEITPRLQRDLDRLATLFADGLARHGGPYLGGAAFSAVDAFYGPVAFRAQTYQLALPDTAAVYLDRLRALPPMAQWYRDALAEPWHDAAHDDEILEHGALIADLRATEPLADAVDATRR